MKPGTHVIAFNKSKHCGQSGIVVADYINMILVLADDQSYTGADTNSFGTGKYFQIDTRWCKPTGGA